MSTLELSGRAPLALPTHLRAAARGAVFIVAGLALAIPCLASLGVALAGRAGPARRVLELMRSVANRVIQAHIPPLQAEPELLWRQKVKLVCVLPVALAAAAIAAIPLLLAVWLIRHGVDGLGSVPDQYLGPWRLAPLPGSALLILSLPSLVLLVATLEWLGSLLRVLLRLGLAVRADAGGAVRQALAESLGDRSLSIAYWLPERSVFVDEHGHPVERLESDSQRAWTLVEHEGRRVAAIVHDAELDARPELVQAAAAGAVMALENEQLKADLRARVEELRASRKRILEEGVEARRRIERDLHDGAQQQLVALSLDLQVLRNHMHDAGAKMLVEASIKKLSDALSELRELARGIHPAVLSQGGLRPALEGLVERAPLPVELDMELEERLPATIEAAAYFVAAEALTNVAKYARATVAKISARRLDGRLELEIADDGIGGADPSRGSGLRGVEDRLSALDGTLTIESPLGHGTRLSVCIPLPDTRDAMEPAR
ncbi:MAG: sensor histidine kinase [Gaiellaceae bacterium]